jgi:Family of unknown function (DUF5681)
MTANAGPKQGGRFQKGQSGNPAGLPKGTRHRATQLAEKLMEDDAEDIVRAVVNAAKAGDPTAMRLCIERLVPVRKGRPTTFDLPQIKTAADVTGALGTIAGHAYPREPLKPSKVSFEGFEGRRVGVI